MTAIKITDEHRYMNLRRLRLTENLRRMTGETELSTSRLVMPYFVAAEERSITSMPPLKRLTVQSLLKEAEEIGKLGIPAVLLFGLPQKKDEFATEAYSSKGPVQKAVRALKRNFPELVVMTDVCLCGYTLSGHCGIVVSVAGHPSTSLGSGGSRVTGHEFIVDDKKTNALLAKVALSHAEAGADIVAPSAMMDGQVEAIRAALDKGAFERVAIMSYSAKYASSFYGPFREAANSTPKFGDRLEYQMNPANVQEALREVQQDISEGADIVMVKPALAYLDVIRRVKDSFNIPLAAYNVSGEYSMVKAAAQRGWLNEKEAALESLLAMRRAGADILITYWAKEAAKWLNHR